MPAKRNDPKSRIRIDADDAWQPRQHAFAVLVAGGARVKDAAAEVKVGTRQGYAWLENPEFRALVGQYRSRFVAETLGKLADSASEAVAALVLTLRSDNGAARVSAARTILENALKFQSAADLSERIERLEQEVSRGARRSHR